MRHLGGDDRDRRHRVLSDMGRFGTAGGIDVGALNIATIAKTYHLDILNLPTPKPMKYLLPILLALICLGGCQKSEKSELITVCAYKHGGLTGMLRIDDVYYQFGTDTFNQVYDYYRSKESLITLSSSSNNMQLVVKRGSDVLGSTSGSGTIMMKLKDGVASAYSGSTNTGGGGTNTGSGSGGSSSGSGCASVQCSGTTQAKKQCKNKTTNCSGRCHLH